MTKRLLQAEFLAFYILLPLLIAVALPPRLMFPLLFAMTLVGAVLLHLTPGFRWPDLVYGWQRIDWRFVLGFTAVTAGVAVVLILLTRPGAFLMLPRHNPELMLTIAALYPFLSALPQELIFRPLFFRRYGGLFPPHWGAILVNACVFAFAHLMYWNLPAVMLTFAGGVAFAWAYEKQRNFPAAVVLHSLAGIIVFASGLGIFFYTGMVERPF